MEAAYTTPELVAQRREVLRLLALQARRERAGHRGRSGLPGRGDGRGGRAGRARVRRRPEREHARARPQPRRRFEIRSGSAEALPLPDDAVDVAVATQVLEYVPDVPGALAEIRRVLRPGGRVLVLDTDWDSIVWHSGDPDRMRAVLAAWEEHLADPWLPRTLGPALRDAGFDVGPPTTFALLNTGTDRGTFSAGLVPLIADVRRRAPGPRRGDGEGLARRTSTASGKRRSSASTATCSAPASRPDRARPVHTGAGTVGDRGAALRQALAARGRRRRSTRGCERRPRARGTGHRRSGRPAGPHPRHRAALRRLRGEHRAAGAPADPAAGVDGRAAHRHHADPRLRRLGRRVAGRRAHPDRRARRLPGRAVGVPVGLRGQPAHPGARHRRRPAAARVRPAAARPRAATPGAGGNDPVAALPSRRIAGRDAAGLRVTPTDPQTTVGSVDIWADPATALPLRVEVAGRTGPPLLSTELLEVMDGPPDPALLRPLAPPGAGAVTAEVVDVAGRSRC